MSFHFNFKEIVKFELLGTKTWGHNARSDAYIDDKPSIVLLEPYNPIPVTGHISELLFYGGRENETETYIQTYRRIGAIMYRIISSTKVDGMYGPSSVKGLSLSLANHHPYLIID